jgi:hypothetical protein
MQRTADFHDEIANTGLPQAAGVVDDAAALDAAVDVLNAHAAAREAPIRRFLRACEVPASRFAGWHDDLHPVECERQAPEILEQAAARGQGIRGGIGNPLIMGASGIRVTQKENGERGVDQQDVVHRVVFFLAAITARRLSRILRALDAPFGAIVSKRGEAGTGLDGCSGGMASAVASATATPRRVASSGKDRAGVSPSVRNVACRTTSKTWIH